MAIVQVMQPAVKASLPLTLVARQYPAITQTLTRTSETLTTVVTLGAGSPTSTSTPPAQPTTTTTAAGTSSPASGSSGLTQDQIGAIIGGIAAFVVVVLILWCCLYQLKRRAMNAAMESQTTLETETTEFSADPWRRGAQRPRRTTTTRTETFRTVPPPTRFPPTARRETWRMSPHPQMRGVRRYP